MPCIEPLCQSRQEYTDFSQENIPLKQALIALALRARHLPIWRSDFFFFFKYDVTLDKILSRTSDD